MKNCEADQNIITQNPARKVIKGLKEKKRVRYVLPEEAEKLRFTLPAWLKPIVNDPIGIGYI